MGAARLQMVVDILVRQDTRRIRCHAAADADGLVSHGRTFGSTRAGSSARIDDRSGLA